MVNIVIPTYQERDTIALIVDKILEMSFDSRVIVVDDQSTDGTSEVLDKLEQIYASRIKVIRRTPPRSFARSYVDGFQLAISNNDCDVVIGMDADGSHPVEIIPEMLNLLLTYHVVIGSRYVSGGNIDGFSKDRQLLSRYANKYIRFMASLPVNDCTSGFMAYRADVLRSIRFDDITTNGYAFLVQMKWLINKMDISMKEVPITFVDRSKGQSKMSRNTIMEAVKLGLKYKFSGLL